MGDTIRNLAKAFIGESQARNRYSFYAAAALKEGLEEIGAFFTLTAENEREHAKWLLRLINQLKARDPQGAAELRVEADVPTTFATTKENLKAAIAGETHEFAEMYPEFAATAEREGHADIAVRLRAIAAAEKHHAERYAKLLMLLESGTLFKRPEPIQWVCRNCGHVHSGTEPPAVCPACSHPKAFFEPRCECY